MAKANGKGRTADASRKSPHGMAAGARCRTRGTPPHRCRTPRGGKAATIMDNDTIHQGDARNSDGIRADIHADIHADMHADIHAAIHTGLPSATRAARLRRIAAGALALLVAAAPALALHPATEGVLHAAATAGAGERGSAHAPERSAARRKADDLSRAFRDAARTLAPSVVTINTFSSRNHPDAAPAAAGSPGQGRGLPPLPPGLGAPRPQQGPARGTGTGVVISGDGYIVTANHVVEGADEIEIVLHDGRTAAASIVGLDPGTDIAVLRTEASGLDPAEFGDSDALEAGEWVVAIGAPFGLQQTVTAGIVSATGRSDVGLATFESYLQTDAAINPGNSGGPLANLDGDIVGINSAISSRGGGNDGIGFAVPASVVRRVADAIIATGRVARGYLGIGVQPADGALLAELGVPDGAGGVLVQRVELDSPASHAGIQRGDVITSIAGRQIRTPGELVATIGENTPGSVVDLRTLRRGDERRLRATLAERPDDGAPQARQPERAAPRERTPSDTRRGAR